MMSIIFLNIAFSLLSLDKKHQNGQPINRTNSQPSRHPPPLCEFYIHLPLKGTWALGVKTDSRSGSGNVQDEPRFFSLLPESKALSIGVIGKRTPETTCNVKGQSMGASKNKNRSGLKHPIYLNSDLK